MMTLEQLAVEAYKFSKEVYSYAHCKELFFIGQKINNLEKRKEYYESLIRDTAAIKEGKKPNSLKRNVDYRYEPVGIRRFLYDPYFLGKEGEIYPEVEKELIEINSGKYVEVVLSGGIGSAKTSTALYTQAYQLYILSCLRNPQELFGLSKEGEILFIFQSITKQLARGVDFERFKNLIDNSPYFQENFLRNMELQSELRFPNRIGVIPVSGTETAAIGQNVIGGIIDELNYMSIVQSSKQHVDGGEYNQAIAVYNSIARRRKSRFMSQGKMPGILCLVSSRRYPGQFTDIKEEEAKKDPTIYVYSKRVWDVKPKGTFSGEKFPVFIGTDSEKPYIVHDIERVPQDKIHLVDYIPVEYRQEFENDLIGSLREIAGVSTLARHPFFINVNAVSAAFGTHQSIFSDEWADFVDKKVQIVTSRFYKPYLPRFVHIDLALTGDSCGIAIGTVDSFVNMKQSGHSTEDVMLPVTYTDGILEIKPPKNEEILFYKVRELLFKLRELGLNIRWVSFDGYQSRDSMQILRQQGFIVGYVSVDTDTLAYDVLKSAIYTKRLKSPTHLKCKKELLKLEIDVKKKKIDHPVDFSKDCSDALAGMVHGVNTRKEIWVAHGVEWVSVTPQIPHPEERPSDYIQVLEPKEKKQAAHRERIERDYQEEEKYIY